MEVYHYTNLNAFPKIVQKGNLEFHASRFDCMNDPNEVKFAEQIIIPALNNLLLQNDAEEVNIYPYILSFTHLLDSPVMWRLYNASLALHFDTEVIDLENKKEMIYVGNDVIYCSKEEKDILGVAKNLIESSIWEIEGSTRIERNRLLAIPFIKHIDYEIEQEWRVVSYDKDGLKASSEHDIKYLEELPIGIFEKGERYGNLHLYKKFRFDKSALVGITVNEHNLEKFEQIKKHLQVWLQSCDYDLDKIPIYQTETAAVR